LLVTLRLLRDQAEGQVRCVLQEAIREIEWLRSELGDGDAEKKSQRAHC